MDMERPSHADQLFIALWKRNFTHIGWLKYKDIKPVIKYHLGPDLTDRQYRATFHTLQHRGHFLECHLAPNQHRSYLFIQNAIPTYDHEARAAATKRLRWHSEYMSE